MKNFLRRNKYCVLILDKIKKKSEVTPKDSKHWYSNRRNRTGIEIHSLAVERRAKPSRNDSYPSRRKNLSSD